MDFPEDPQVSDPLRLGIAGLGTVGTGVVRILQENRDAIMRRTGREIVVSAVSARERSKERPIDPVVLSRRSDVDVYVELIGGEAGVAKESVETAISTGKDVVTANKAMLAVHGQQVAELAEAKGCTLRFEAAVAGGIPVIKALSESMAADRIVRVMGVMNGTWNYILTRM